MQKRNAIIVGIIAVALLAGGGAYAYFSDSEQTQQSFHAGTLYLKVDGNDPWATAPFSVSNVKPGDHGQASMNMQNAGTIAGTLSFSVSGVVDDLTANPHINTTIEALSNNMRILAYQDVNGNGAYNAGTDVLLYNGSVSGATGSYGAISLAPSASTPIVVNWQVPSTTGNGIMGDGLTFNLVFTLTQA